MPVLKQISPTGAGVPVCAPKPRPQNTVPSARTSAAVAPGGMSPPWQAGLAAQFVHRQAGGGADGGPMARRNGSGLAPFPHGLGGDPGQAGRGFGPPRRSMIVSMVAGMGGV